MIECIDGRIQEFFSVKCKDPACGVIHLIFKTDENKDFLLNVHLRDRVIFIEYVKKELGLTN